jgi:hypothetical protein
MCPNDTLSTTNLTRTGTGMNPGLHNERSATNCASHGTATNYNISINVFYLPNDAQLNFLKNNFKTYIKTASTCSGVTTIIREHIIPSC